MTDEVMLNSVQAVKECDATGVPSRQISPKQTPAFLLIFNGK
jgi:hypothetical protein